MAHPTLSRRRKPPSLLPLWLLLGAIVIGLGFVIYYGVRQNSNNPVIRSQDDIPRVSPQEAFEAMQSGQAILVDTRSRSDFDLSHAQGAINIPLAEAETIIPTLDPSLWYITYCT